MERTATIFSPLPYGARPALDEEDPLACLFRVPAGDSFVIGQIGQSLDGRIATVSGESRYISGTAALVHLHRIRAHVDAVIVGAGTIEADDPQLTVRHVSGANPARVVIDPSGRLGARGKWLAADGVRRIRVSAQRCGSMPGVEDLVLPRKDGKIAPAAMVAGLRALGLRRILVEGGARTLAQFLEAGCLDRLHVLVAPVIIGSGRPGLDLSPVPQLARALRPETRVHVLGGGDVLFDCDLAGCRRSAS